MGQLRTCYILEWIQITGWIHKLFSINIVSVVIGAAIILPTTRGQRSVLSECHSSLLIIYSSQMSVPLLRDCCPLPSDTAKNLKGNSKVTDSTTAGYLGGKAQNIYIIRVISSGWL